MNTQNSPICFPDESPSAYHKWLWPDVNYETVFMPIENYSSKH